MQSKRRATLTAGLCLLLLVLYVLIPQEPRYRGKRLTDWLYETNVFFAPEEDDEATIAVRNIGTNALSFLMKMLRREDSAFKRKLMELAKKQSMVAFQFRDAVETRREAEWGLAALGPIAKPVVPELIKLLQHPNSEIRRAAAEALSSVGQDAREAVPALIDALKDPEPDVRHSSVKALGKIGLPAEAAVPALVALLRDELSKVERLTSVSGYDRYGLPTAPTVTNIVETFGRIGPASREALPELLNALRHRYDGVRRAATNALKRIDPEIAAKEGVK